MRGILALLVVMTIIGSVTATDVSSSESAAPAFFRVKYHTTIGDIVLNITRANAPLGVDRFYNVSTFFFSCGRMINQ
jgi:hypothetical protein